MSRRKADALKARYLRTNGVGIILAGVLSASRCFVILINVSPILARRINRGDFISRDTNARRPVEGPSDFTNERSMRQLEESSVFFREIRLSPSRHSAANYYFFIFTSLTSRPSCPPARRRKEARALALDKE